MKKFIAAFLRKLSIKLEGRETQESIKEQATEQTVSQQQTIETVEAENSLKKKQKTKTDLSSISFSEKPIRDVMEIMELPFLALSKNRRNPIIYENLDRGIKIKVSRHTGHFLASIYDWDIVLFVASKMQEILNSGLDIPPRTIIFPRHEIFKVLHRYDGKKEEKDLKASLARLQLTGIETSIRNEDFRYEAGFGFIDSWGYTQRKDIREIKITLSQWLYDGICAQGNLLKVDPTYFDLKSGLKRFLYRTARKHIGNNEKIWEFSIEKLYEKSGSERELRKFKSDLKLAVLDNDLPNYSIQWLKKGKKEFVTFKCLQPQEMETILLF